MHQIMVEAAAGPEYIAGSENWQRRNGLGEKEYCGLVIGEASIYYVFREQPFFSLVLIRWE